MLEQFVARNDYCDYVTAAEADRYAVREIAELALSMMGVFDAVVRSRSAYDDDYRQYFSARQAVETQLVRRSAT